MSKKKVLALVSGPISAEAVESALGEEASDAEVHVVAPALISRTRHFLADPDPAIDRAQDVADESVASLDDAGIEATGDTGESDPLLALQDALATFAADEIVLLTHAEGERNWLEEGLVEKAQERFSVPVRHLELA